MASDISSSNKKSCCWLGHSCWLKMVFGLVVIGAGTGLYFKHARMEREIASLSNQIKKGTPGQLQTQLDTLDMLINIAEIQLNTFGDKGSALSYLSRANEQVRLLPETPEQRALQEALKDATQKITAIEIVPLQTVSDKLDALIEQSRGLTVVQIATNAVATSPKTDATVDTQQPTANPTTSVSPEKEKDWQEKLQEGWVQLKSLVKSEDKGKSDNLVESWLVPAKLGIQLEEIKLAAFYHDDNYFRHLIGQTIDWLGNHFDLEKNEKALAIKKTLETMKDWRLGPDTDILSQSMVALNALKKKPATY